MSVFAMLMFNSVVGVLELGHDKPAMAMAIGAAPPELEKEKKEKHYKQVHIAAYKQFCAAMKTATAKEKEEEEEEKDKVTVTTSSVFHRRRPIPSVAEASAMLEKEKKAKHDKWQQQAVVFDPDWPSWPIGLRH